MTPAARATYIVLCLIPLALLTGAAWPWWAMAATLAGVKVVARCAH